MTVRTRTEDDVLVVILDRPEVRNAVDRPTADALEEAFRRFDADDGLSAAVLTGAGETFCSGADLHAIAADDPDRMNRLESGARAPMGPTRLRLGKPVIAAIEGHAVAGGLELALWCDLRVAASDAILGVFCRRWGVPLVDGGTVRLPRLIGASRAMDLVLTGRPVGAAEALDIGLVNRVVETGTAESSALELARGIARHPQTCLRSDRASLLDGFDLHTDEALQREHQLGMATIATGETGRGASRFREGAGRGGRPDRGDLASPSEPDPRLGAGDARAP